MPETKTQQSAEKSQSAFVRGFIDDEFAFGVDREPMTSQSAFVRGFIDDPEAVVGAAAGRPVSIRVRARLHR